MRSVFTVCLGAKCLSDLRYTQIELPATPYRILDALDELSIKTTKEIVYQEIEHYGGFDCLAPHFNEFTSLEELNALAQKLAAFGRYEEIAFEGMIGMETAKHEPFGIDRIIDLAYNSDNCHIVSDIHTDEELGRFYAGNGFIPELDKLPDHIFEKLNFALIGKEAREKEHGVFTPRGYVMQDDEEDFQSVYDTLDLSLTKPSYAIRVVLESQLDGQCVALELPATQKQIELTLMEIDLTSWENATIREYDGPLWDLNLDLYEMGGIEPLNRLAEAVEGMNDEQVLKLKAAVAFSKSSSVTNALDIAAHIDSYGLDAHVFNPESMGKEALNTIVDDKDAAILAKHLNLYAYGKEMLELSGYQITPYGLLIPNFDMGLDQTSDTEPKMTM